MKLKLVLASMLLIFLLPSVMAGSAVDLKISMVNGTVNVDNMGIQGQSYIEMKGNSALNIKNVEDYSTYKNIIWMDAEQASVRDVTPEFDNRFKDIKNLNGTFVTERSFKVSSEEEKETEENITIITTTFDKTIYVTNSIDVLFDSGTVDMSRILVAGPKSHPVISNVYGNFTAPAYMNYNFYAFGNQTWQTVDHLPAVEGEGT